MIHGKKLGLITMIGMFAVPLAAQDNTFTARRNTPRGGATENGEIKPVESLELPIRNLDDPDGGTLQGGGLLLEQNEEGDLTISFWNKITDGKTVIVIPAVDSLGYFPLKKFLRDIDRDFAVKWKKYESIMRGKEKAFLDGHEVDLRYLPISSMIGKDGLRLDFGARPWFYVHEDETKAKIRSDAYFRIVPRKGKPKECCVGYDVYRNNACVDWFLAAIKYQLDLKKRK